MTITELLAGKIGTPIGGGFVLTIKTTKKSIQLPSKRYIHTVILFDNTGEMLADFKDPTVAGYMPLIRGQQVHIIVAEIQSADPTSNKIALKEAKKLFVDQYEVVKGDISKPDNYFQGFDDMPDWETIVKGKIRHGIVCSLIQEGKTFEQIQERKSLINQAVDFIMTGE